MTDNTYRFDFLSFKKVILFVCLFTITTFSIFLFTLNVYATTGTIMSGFQQSIFLDTDLDKNGASDFINWLPLCGAKSPDNKCPNPVVISDLFVSGDIWGETVGWIRLSPQGGFGGVINNGQGVLSGYAWGENTGWINFNCEGIGAANSCNDNDNYKVVINPETGEFSGYAWSENFGWLRFDCGKGYSCVKTDWRPTVEKPEDEIIIIPPANTERIGGGGELLCYILGNCEDTKKLNNINRKNSDILVGKDDAVISVNKTPNHTNNSRLRASLITALDQNPLFSNTKQMIRNIIDHIAGYPRIVIFSLLWLLILMGLYFLQVDNVVVYLIDLETKKPIHNFLVIIKKITENKEIKIYSNNRGEIRQRLKNGLYEIIFNEKKHTVDRYLSNLDDGAFRFVVDKEHKLIIKNIFISQNK